MYRITLRNHIYGVIIVEDMYDIGPQLMSG